MLIRRAEDLGFVSDITAKRLWINYSRRGWRTHEPLDDEFDVEQPKLLRRSFELLFEEKVLTGEQVLSHLPFSSNDIERLAGLDPGFLTNSEIELGPQIALLRKGKPERQQTGPGQLLSFPVKRPPKV